jgi:hypothetical protein
MKLKRCVTTKSEFSSKRLVISTKIKWYDRRLRLMADGYFPSSSLAIVANCMFDVPS